MFAIPAKIKIAAGIAAGALTLGAAGAYAANANNSITVDPTKSFTLGTNTGAGTTLNLVPVNSTATLTLPSGGFKDPGQCVSWLASNRNYALAPTNGATKISKNYHGKLMSAANAFCKNYVSATAKTNAAETETPDAAQSATPETDGTDATDTESGALHGNGHAYGHSKHATD